MKQKILLLIKVPPPVTGATLMNLSVRNSVLLNSSFDIKSFGLSYANSVKDLGSISIKKFLLLIKYYFYLIRYLFKTKFNLVYFQISPIGSTFFRDFIFVIILKLFRVKIIYHLHGKGIKKKSKNFIYRILYKIAFKNEFIIIVSELLKYEVEYFKYKKIFIVPNGIPEINYIPKESVNYIKPLKILFLSNLLCSKGLNDFIESMALLNEKDVDIKAYIIGEEADFSKNELEKIIISKNLDDKLIYLGPKYADEKMRILNDTDLLIYPTLENIWGNVNLEAMQFGIPIIATNEGAIPEIIDDGITGFIVEKNRPDKIAVKVETLYHNRELLHKMGLAGRKKYEENYTLETFNKNMKNVFEEVLNHSIKN